MPLVAILLVVFGGLAVNNHNADHPVKKWRDVKHSVEVSVENRQLPPKKYND